MMMRFSLRSLKFTNTIIHISFVQMKHRFEPGTWCIKMRDPESLQIIILDCSVTVPRQNNFRNIVRKGGSRLLMESLLHNQNCLKICRNLKVNDPKPLSGNYAEHSFLILFETTRTKCFFSSYTTWIQRQMSFVDTSSFTEELKTPHCPRLDALFTYFCYLKCLLYAANKFHKINILGYFVTSPARLFCQPVAKWQIFSTIRALFMSHFEQTLCNVKA